MSFVTIFNAVKTKLETLVDATLKEVIGYKIEPLEYEFNSFPVAEVIESANEADYLSTKEDMEIYAYEIYIYQDVEKAGGMNEAYGILRSTVDTIKDTFRSDQDLGGVVDWIEPIHAGFTDFARRNQTIAVAIITLKCHKVKLF